MEIADPRYGAVRGMVAVDTMTTPVASPNAESASALANLQAFVVRMQGGDQSALEALYDATCARLYALATAILRDREDAEEVVCDTYTQAWKDAARYDAARASPMGWLTVLCRSRALDRLRQRRHHALAVQLEEAEAVVDPSASPDDLLSKLEQGSHVHAALASLPAERRELVALAFLRGLSHQEIADLKQLPLGTVKSHVRRSLLQLRAALDGLTFDEVGR
jgi:RNA polymerase sigma-70 factor (ECF subfamily)